jgi:hypothetical protein
MMKGDETTIMIQMAEPRTDKKTAQQKATM